MGVGGGLHICYVNVRYIPRNQVAVGIGGDCLCSYKSAPADAEGQACSNQRRGTRLQTQQISQRPLPGEQVSLCVCVVVEGGMLRALIHVLQPEGRRLMRRPSRDHLNTPFLIQNFIIFSK